MASACVYLECPITHMILGVSRKDDPNAWGLPGGKVEDGESERHAAFRELLEETGVFINSDHLVEIFRREGGVTFGVLSGLGGFMSSVRMVQRNEETGRVGWVTPEQLMAGPFGDYNRRLLEEIGRI